MHCNAYLRLMKIKNSHPPDINNFKRNLDVISYIIHVSFFLSDRTLQKIQLNTYDMKPASVRTETP